MKTTLTLLTFLITLATATAQVPMLRWDDPNELGFSNKPVFRQASDIDGDGYPEIVFAHRDPGDPNPDIWVYSLALGQPLLVFPGSVQRSSFDPTEILTTPDFTGDGLRDYLFRRFSASLVISLELRNGLDGSMVWTVDDAVLGGIVSSPNIVIEDVNGDGVGDVYVTINNSPLPSSATILSGVDGSVIYEIHESFAMSTPSSLGDLDGDGAGDFGVQSVFGGDFFIYSGATGTQIQFRDAGASAVSVRRSLVGVGDVDGDGLNDWAETWEKPVFPVGSSIHFFTNILNPREIGVYAGQRFDFSLRDTPIFAHDFDGDGLNDILIRSEISTPAKDSVTLFSPVNGLIREWSHAVGPTPHALDADWNGDGVPDLLMHTFVVTPISLLVVDLREKITVSPPDISQSTGGTLTFTVDAGSRYSGRRVQLMAGDGPRRPFKAYLMQVPGGANQMVGFPFAPTRVTRRIFDHRDTPELADWTTTLDSQGQATLTIDFAPGELSTSLIDHQLHFTAMIESPTPPYPETSTERISVQILP